VQVDEPARGGVEQRGGKQLTEGDDDTDVGATLGDLIGDLPGSGRAADREAEFARRGVILRPMTGWGFPNAFRLSIGTRAENLAFLSALDEIRDLGLLPLVAAAMPAVS